MGPGREERCGFILFYFQNHILIMKKTFTTLAFVLAAAAVMAVPAKRGQWRTVTLADGSRVRVELRGDEFMSYWQAEDGRRFVKDHGTKRYKVADMAVLREKAVALREKANIGQARHSSPTRGGMTRAGSAYEGEKKGLVVLVEFPDMRFTHGTRELYDKILNQQDYTDESLGFVGSVSDYFRDQSRGVFNLTFDVAGPVMMPEGYAYYGGDSPYQDANIGEMLRYALNAVDDEIDYTKYDWNGDGQVEQVFFIYAGLGQANGGEDNTIWPHKSAVTNEAGTGYVTLDGMRIFDYACSCELQPWRYHEENGQIVIDETHIDGPGTICHEFSHCLGLPDIYDTDYSGGYGMASWDIMCSGSYNDNGFHPSCYTGAERMWIGWEQPVELTENTTVEGMKSIEDGGGAYIIRCDANPDEYYILENRQQTGRWDAGLPGSGLLVTHVDYNQSAWQNNSPNNDPDHQRCIVIPADNNFYTSNDNVAGDAWPNGDNNSLTNDSRPAAEVYAKQADGTYLMSKPITDITQNEDGTVSFSFSIMDTTPLFYESFDGCSGRGGNDGNFVNIPASLGKGTFNTDNEGWTGTGGGASKCAMFEGEASTPAFTVNGRATMTFAAGGVVSTSSGDKISLAVNGDAKLSGTQADLSLSKMTNYSVDIEGNGPISITFSSNGQFFLDEVRVSNALTTGIDRVTVTPAPEGKPADNRIYTVDGRYVGTDASKLDKGIYIRNGKKIIKR